MNQLPVKFSSPALRYVIICISVWGLLVVILLSSCRKEDDGSPPLIEFLTDSGFVSHDTTLGIGTTIRVGIEANGVGSNLTYFHIGWSKGDVQVLLDSGINQPRFRHTLSITKTASETEIWTFLVMDRHRNFNEIRIILTRTSSSQYGPVISYDDVLLGAQASQGAGSFFSIGANRSYFLDEAFQRQDSVDMIYYFDQYDATLSSPAEADAPAIFGGPTGIAHWTVKQETRYDTTGLSPESFELSVNDSLILAVYEPVNLKRKAKFLQPGMVVSFRDPGGRLGLIRVREVIPGPEGSIRFDMKIQQP